MHTCTGLGRTSRPNNILHLCECPLAWKGQDWGGWWPRPSPPFLFPTPPSHPLLSPLSFGPSRAGHPLSGIDSKDSPTAGLTEMSKLDLNRPFRTPLRGLLERGLVGAGGYSPADRKQSWDVGSFTCTHPTSSLAHKAADLHTFNEFGAPLHSVSLWFSHPGPPHFLPDPSSGSVFSALLWALCPVGQ